MRKQTRQLPFHATRSTGTRGPAAKVVGRVAPVLLYNVQRERIERKAEAERKIKRTKHMRVRACAKKKRHVRRGMYVRERERKRERVRKKERKRKSESQEQPQLVYWSAHGGGAFCS